MKFEVFVCKIEHLEREHILKSVPNMAFIERTSNTQMKYACQDRCNSFIGKCLLEYGIQKLGIDDTKLSDLKFTEKNKPYFERGINFNITHSEDLVACAITKDTEIGLDVEKIRNIDLEWMRRFLHPNEQELVFGPINPVSFFDFWTKKEAFLKAIGIGISFNLQSLDFTKDHAYHLNSKYSLVGLSLSNDHACHIAYKNIPNQEKVEPNIVIYHLSCQDLVNRIT